MSRLASKRGQSKTPESGYKFDCDYCEGEIFQAGVPELCFAIEMIGSGKSASLGSASYQACRECAIEIKDNNDTWMRENKQAVRQVRALRPNTELEKAIPEELRKAAEAKAASSASTDAKLDKVLDAIAALTQLMTLQLQSQIGVVPKPATIKAPVLTPPKPKRAILAPPVVKTSAKKQPAKPSKRAESKAKGGSKAKPRTANVSKTRKATRGKTR